MRIKTKAARCKARSAPRRKISNAALARKSGTTVFLMSLERARRLKCLPAWADTSKILAVYIKAQYYRILGRGEYHVDHQIPLVNFRVCGLHTSQNLQILTKRQNERKSNNFTPYRERNGVRYKI